MSLRIAVLLKSVPDPKLWHRVTIDPVTRTLRKEGIPRVISPLDRNALEAAASLKEKHGGEVTVICMGSSGAKENLREALALGADRAVFLSGGTFGGADSLATARALSAALQKLGIPDLIFCGAVSYYGSTGQVGPQVAQMLGINHFSSARKFVYDGNMLTVESVTDGGVLVARGRLPLLLTVLREANKPRGLRLSETVKARRKEILEWSPADLPVSGAQLGLEGSGTRMIDLLPPTPGKDAEIIEGEPEVVAREILRKISVWTCGTGG
ncbi:MAG: electron transfer flavoprotein subunit beta/FixA family protein [Dethiobacter sp.]|jgi:electron transfer flavoprotein beta subunit|nr:electron transfer flavoprotein subunit beta/FixA family protein [Dethiobacter sp.]